MTASDLPAGATFDADTTDRVWTEHLDGLLDDWEDLTDGQRQAIREQVAAAVEDGDPAALAGIEAPADATTEALAAALFLLLLAAVALAVIEALSQGVDIPGLPTLTDAQRAAWGDGEPGEDDLELLARLFLTPERQAWVDGYARTTATRLARGLGGAAAAETLRVWTDPAPDATPAEVRDNAERVAQAVDEYLAGLSQAYLSDQLGGALHMALNTGRVALLEVAPVATYAASEVLDRNTCAYCREVDGTTYESLADAAADYPTGGYRDCEGGLRCRGVIVAVWSQPEE